jgi:outer membrane murein-binding lipoprotein Lpp
MARRALWLNNVLHPTVATQEGFAILRLAPVMKKIGPFLFAGFFFFAALPQLRSQSEDPSEIFLKAYMTAQQAEKLEHENQFKAALAKYRFAGSLIEELRKSHPDWQSAIVEYRGRKISDGIMRVQGKVSTQDDLNAGPPPPPLPETAPAISENAAPTVQPSVEIVAPGVTEARAEPSPPSEPPPQAQNEAAIKAATSKLQSKVDQLEEELQKSRSQFGGAEKEKNALNGRLQETTSKLEKAQSELHKSKSAEQKARDQLTQAQNSLKKVQSATGTDAKAQEALRAEIAQLKRALAAVEEGRSAAEKG